MSNTIPSSVHELPPLPIPEDDDNSSIHTDESTLEVLAEHSRQLCYKILGRKKKRYDHRVSFKFWYETAFLFVFQTNIENGVKASIQGIWYQLCHVFGTYKSCLNAMNLVISDLKVPRGSLIISPDPDGKRKQLSR